VQQRKKIQLAFFTEQQGYISRLCIPLGYQPETEDDEGQYCFWHDQDNGQECPLSLSPIEIAVMQLTEDEYDPADLPPLETKEFSWLLQTQQKGLAGKTRRDCRKQ
ncbi:MAG: hypothetical protein ACYST6_15960, partial [Planctomycetota bacterium]